MRYECVVITTEALNLIKILELEDYNASWKLTKLEGGKVKIEFQVFSAEPPLFPQWIQEPVLKKVFYKNLVRFERSINK